MGSQRPHLATTTALHHRTMALALQRSSLHQDWGLTLQYSIQDEKLLLGVKEVVADSPACRSLRVGDIITTINDWQVQHIKQPDVAANLLRAAGNTVTLDVERDIVGKNWRPLDSF